jgi:hypothetical protein
VGGKRIIGNCYLAVTQEGIQRGNALSTDRASYIIQDAKMLLYALGLLGLRYVLEVLYNTRRPLLIGLLGRFRTYKTIEYIDRDDKSLPLIVFNFTEYLTSTLCINLPL